MPLRKTLSRSPSVTDSRAEDFALASACIFAVFDGHTLATYAPIPAVIFSFSLLLSTPDPGPGCTWPGCSSWVPTRRLVRISNPRLRGTQAQKPRPRSEKPWRWAWP